MKKICEKCGTEIDHRVKAGIFAAVACAESVTEIKIGSDDVCKDCFDKIQLLVEKYCNDDKIKQAVNDYVQQDYNVTSMSFSALITLKKEGE